MKGGGGQTHASNLSGHCVPEEEDVLAGLNI